MRAMTKAAIATAAALVAAGTIAANRSAVGEPGPDKPAATRPAATAPSAGTRPAIPLAGLPGKPGPHVEKVKALGGDSWLALGSPAPDPVWGKARGRAWTPKMAYAPDLGAAFLYGEGQHAFVKPDGRFQDDLWAYDVFAHRWICVYPGSSLKELQVTLDRHGFDVGPDGDPVPVCQAVHGYLNMTYDTDARKLMFLPCGSPYSRSRLGARLTSLPAGMDRKRIRMCPWFYDTRAGRFERKYVEGVFPDGTNMEATVEYVSSKKQFFWMHVRTVWFYNPAGSVWVKSANKGAPPPFGIDPVACLDTKRDRVYLHKGDAFCVYDIKTETWLDLQPTGTLPKGTGVGGVAETMTYDSASDVVILNDYRQCPRKGIFVYDPAANTWTTEPRPIPKEITDRTLLNAFYCPELNVHVFHGAGDSDDNGAVWVYRYAPR